MHWFWLKVIFTFMIFCFNFHFHFHCTLICDSQIWVLKSVYFQKLYFIRIISNVFWTLSRKMRRLCVLEKLVFIKASDFQIDWMFFFNWYAIEYLIYFFFPKYYFECSSISTQTWRKITMRVFLSIILKLFILCLDLTCYTFFLELFLVIKLRIFLHCYNCWFLNIKTNIFRENLNLSKHFLKTRILRKNFSELLNLEF